MKKSNYIWLSTIHTNRTAVNQIKVQQSPSLLQLPMIWCNQNSGKTNKCIIVIDVSYLFKKKKENET